MTEQHSQSDAPEPSPNWALLESEVLEFWKEDDTFSASLKQRERSPEWVFYDGPPFANGLPHFGHLLTGYAKDVFPRYRTMRGWKVPRVFGWDTHGLPAELEAMSQLGITEKADIEKMGIGEFNAAARNSVLTYVQEWEDYVTRQARWVDFGGGYKTLDLNYMESVIWAFKQLYDRGLAYEGYRVLPYCWRDQTPLSNHELRMDEEVYKPRQDPDLTVTFPLCGAKAEQLGLRGALALAWTTTPWTLPTNQALAVGPEIKYALLPAGPEGTPAFTAPAPSGFLLAVERLPAYAEQLGYRSAEAAAAAVTATFSGDTLRGVRYEPLFSFYTAAEHGSGSCWQILADDYVSVAEGTGLVHQAPAFGEDDQRVCAAAGLPVLLSIDDGARFLTQISEYAGQHIFEANPQIIRDLKARGRVLVSKTFEHSYPHCWRCRNPLIYRAVTSWFVRVAALREQALALNQQINWVPENVKDGQFGKWLSGARDWSVSRNRYWGSPIPVWKSDDPQYPRVDVYGSIAELERDFGAKVTDLHRPEIDRLTRANPDDPTGRSLMRRIPDVLDVWFDSASMPFAQVHYPFENREWFENHSPADFVVEYVGQARGWFYMMHIMAVALWGTPAFKNVVCHGIILGDDGQKASKSLRNYPDVNEVFKAEGSDAVRWYLLSSSILNGGNLAVSRRGIRESMRQLLLPLWSSWYFFRLYADTARGKQGGYRGQLRYDSPHILDRYVLAKTGDLIREVTRHMDALDANAATVALRDYVELLTNWYIRRSRERFWEGLADRELAADGSAEKNQAAFDTLHTILATICQLAAPLLPLVSEHVYRSLTGQRSVHLCDWPDPELFPREPELVASMDRVRRICSTGLSLRKRLGIRVRQPLRMLTVVNRLNRDENSKLLALPNVCSLAPFIPLIAAELNVKEVKLLESPPPEGAPGFVSDTTPNFRRRLKVFPRLIGPRLGPKVQQVLAAAKEGRWEESPEGQILVSGEVLLPGEFELLLELPEDTGKTSPEGIPEVDISSETGCQLLPEDGYISLDTRLTPELESEGYARDAIRVIQEERRQAGLDVADRILLTIRCREKKLWQALQEFSQLIALETLATRIEIFQDSEQEENLSLELRVDQCR